jgi:spore germination protein KC
MNKKKFLFGGPLLLLLLLSGCWDFEEIDRRAFITTLGIDLAPQNQVEVSDQIPFSQDMLPPGSRAGTKENKVFQTLSVTSRTVYEGFRNLQTKTTRRLVIQQNKALIFSQAAAREEIGSFMAWIERSPKAPPQALVFVTQQHTAKEILSFTPILKNLPGLEYVVSSQSKVKYDQTYFIPFWLFRQKLLYGNADAFAPLLDFNQQEGVYVKEGLAVFNGFRMAGELDASEAKLFGILTGKMKNGGLTLQLDSPEYGAGVFLSLRGVKGSSKVEVEIKDGAPLFRVSTKVTCSVSELVRDRRELTPNHTKELEKTIAKFLRPRLENLIKKLQGFNSDPINFGEALRITHFKWWRTHRWKKVFPTIPFAVKVQVNIERDGVLR